MNAYLMHIASLALQYLFSLMIIDAASYLSGMPMLAAVSVTTTNLISFLLETIPTTLGKLCMRDTPGKVTGAWRWRLPFYPWSVV